MRRNKGTYQGHPNLEVFESVIEGTEVVAHKIQIMMAKLKHFLSEEIEEIISHMNSDHSTPSFLSIIMRESVRPRARL